MTSNTESTVTDVAVCNFTYLAVIINKEIFNIVRVTVIRVGEYLFSNATRGFINKLRNVMACAKASGGSTGIHMPNGGPLAGGIIMYIRVSIKHTYEVTR